MDALNPPAYRRSALALLVMPLLAALVAFGGFGVSQAHAQSASYQKGYAAGMAKGREHGYTDGFKGAYKASYIDDMPMRFAPVK